MTNLNIILASASPRRRELLGILCDDFQVVVSDCEEIIRGEIPEEITKELSRQKASAVANKCSRPLPAIVIGADTIVCAEGEILGKPKDTADAYRMIAMLSGRTHKVITGVSLILLDKEGNLAGQKSFSETTLVHVAPMTDAEIRQYVESDEPYDKAGAYGIQGKFGKYIEGIEGDYNNVVGLPVHRLYVEMHLIFS